MIDFNFEATVFKPCLHDLDLSTLTASDPYHVGMRSYTVVNFSNKAMKIVSNQYGFWKISEDDYESCIDAAWSHVVLCPARCTSVR